ncbi:uncharacterized protein LOC144636186 [Oculina patagonica]
MPHIFVRSNIIPLSYEEQRSERWAQQRRHVGEQMQTENVYASVKVAEYQWTTYIDLNHGEVTELEALISQQLSAVRLGDPNCISYRTDKPPPVVLDLLESQSYKVVGTSASGDTYTWTLHKDA